MITARSCRLCRSFHPVLLRYAAVTQFRYCVALPLRYLQLLRYVGLCRCRYYDRTVTPFHYRCLPCVLPPAVLFVTCVYVYLRSYVTRYHVLGAFLHRAACPLRLISAAFLRYRYVTTAVFTCRYLRYLVRLISCSTCRWFLTDDTLHYYNLPFIYLTTCYSDILLT